MEEQSTTGRRLPAPGRPAAEARPTPQPAQAAPRPVPAQQPAPAYATSAHRGLETETVPPTEAPAPRARAHPGVPMATARQQPQPQPAHQRPAQADVEVEPELDFGTDLPAPARTAPAKAALAPRTQTEAELEEIRAGDAPETGARAYATRRAFAEQLAKDDATAAQAAERDVVQTGLDGFKERREAWRRTVKAKEAEGKAPYISRNLKGAFFPFLYVVISLQLLRRYQFEYGDFYDFEPLFILVGFALGLLTLFALESRSMLRARRARSPVALSDRGVMFGVVVFIAVSVYLAAFKGLAFAWLFSIGFMGAGLIVPVAGMAIERLSKGRFWVTDPTSDSSVARRFLEFVPAAAEA